MPTTTTTTATITKPTNPTPMVKSLQDLAPGDVRSVYSGRAGKCMCGCAGHHRYASALRDEAGLKRGYPISDDEVNDVMVRRVLRLVQAHEEEITDAGGDEFGLANYIGAHIGGRDYTVYLRQGVQCDVSLG